MKSLVGKVNIKFLLNLLGIFVFLIAGAYGAQYYLNYQKQSKTSKPEPTKREISQIVPQKEILKMQDVAKINLQWLKEQKDARGFYYKSLSCSVDGCKDINKAGDSGHDGLTTVWAWFNDYLINGSDDDFSMVVEAINSYEKGLNKMEMQNDFWNCKIMYELWKSGFFNKQQKAQIERICFTGTYLNADGVESFYSRDKDGITLDSVIKMDKPTADVDLNKGKNQNLVIDNKVKQNLTSFAAFSSDFSARYEWKKKEDDLKVAKAYFNKVVSIYFKEENVFTNSDVCTLGISGLDLYRVTNKDEYLKFAESIFDKMKDSKNTKYNVPLCGILADQLFKKTEKALYRQREYDIANYIVENYFDYKDNKMKLDEEGGFFKVDPNKGLGLTKEIQENGLITVLLSNLW